MTKSLEELSPENLLGEFRKNILPSICADLVALNKSPCDFEKELQPYLKNIVDWVKNYMPNDAQKPLGDDVIVESVHDIEDNIWSPTIGVKGKIDVSFKTKQVCVCLNNSK